MKKFIYILIGCTFFLLSCNEERENTSQLSSTLREGSWRISNFDYTDRNITGFYTGYKFTFTEQNVVTAIGINFYAGKWIVKDDGDPVILILEFTRINPIQILNYDWKVISYDNQTINLAWDNPYFGGTDYVSFEKI